MTWGLGGTQRALDQLKLPNIVKYKLLLDLYTVVYKEPLAEELPPGFW